MASAPVPGLPQAQALAQVQAIDIEHAAEGMQLARDVHDSNGALLLQKGARLSSASLASLRRRGIASLVVSVAPDPAGAPDLAGATPGASTPAASTPGPADPAVRQAEREAERDKRKRRLQHLFRNSGSGAGPLLLERLLHYREQLP